MTGLGSRTGIAPVLPSAMKPRVILIAALVLLILVLTIIAVWTAIGDRPRTL
jgi:hypothetical protein